MFKPASPSRPTPSLWTRIAAWLSFLAVFAALLAPVSMLAEEVRTGKLGGICAVNTAFTGGADTSDGATPQTGSHCDLCGSLGLALPPLAVASIPCFPGSQVASVSLPADVVGSIPGLPPGRGPPAL